MSPTWKVVTTAGTYFDTAPHECPGLVLFLERYDEGGTFRINEHPRLRKFFVKSGAYSPMSLFGGGGSMKITETCVGTHLNPIEEKVYDIFTLNGPTVTMEVNEVDTPSYANFRVNGRDVQHVNMLSAMGPFSITPIPEKKYRLELWSHCPHFSFPHIAIAELDDWSNDGF